MNNYNPNTIIKELEKVILELLVSDPFFGKLLAESVKDIHKDNFGISLIQSEQNIVKLCVNTRYWEYHLKGSDDKQTILLRKKELKKQALHFIFNHDSQISAFDQKAVFITTAELVVNQFLNIEEIEHWFLPKKLPEHKLNPFRPLKYFYKELFKNLTSNELFKTIDFNSWQFDYYKNWKKYQSARSDMELNWCFRKKIILNAFPANHAKTKNSLPTPLIEFIDQLKIENRKTLNWKRILHLFCNSSTRTKLTNTIHRSSKRFGTFPGTRIRNQSRILVAIDTSGSVHGKDLTLFFNEVHQLWRQKAEIQILECDTSIHRKHQYKGVFPEIIKGRGNTDFNAAIQYSNDEFQPDALIYFTDGLGHKPRMKSIKPILWVIKKNGIKSHSKAWNDLPGRKVKIEDRY